jgi:hypothetical protein
MLYKILEFIAGIRKVIYLILFLHYFRLFEYSLSVSIPYEHFNKK